ncbi:MAG: homoserine dehydrogenase [Halioglobus sp.]
MHYNLALIGFGGVNRALVELILEKNRILKNEHNLHLDIVAISDMYFGSTIDPNGLDMRALMAAPPEKGVLARFPKGSEIAANDDVIGGSNADIVVEATFTNPETGEPASSHCRSALSAGKHVVTTNKGPIAIFGEELSNLAATNNVFIRYEGAVMSGTPVIGLAENCLRGCDVTGFRGILNGTANHILGRIEDGCTMEEAIKEAQDFGYAEADPTADLEGYDVVLKVTILANLLLGANLNPGDVSREGISELSEVVIRHAAQRGQHWKLLAEATRHPDGLVEASVSPLCLSDYDPLASVSGALNAVCFQTDLLGDVTVSGPGAGKTATAYALLTDILAIDLRKRTLELK